MFGNTAYIYVGSAARIAFTLGLHARDDVESHHSLQEQVNVRLFCSLYLLDLDTALCYGNPPAIDEGIVFGVPRAPSEHVCEPRRKRLTKQTDDKSDSRSWIQYALGLSRSFLSTSVLEAQSQQTDIPKATFEFPTLIAFDSFTGHL